MAKLVASEQGAKTAKKPLKIKKTAADKAAVNLLDGATMDDANGAIVPGVRSAIAADGDGGGGGGGKSRRSIHRRRLFSGVLKTTFP